MTTPILEISKLSVEVEGQTILKNIDLSIKEHSVNILFGPNGSGKSTLIRTIMGFSGYKVVNGDIRFRGKSILALNTDERARAGIGIMFQHPPTIRGVRLAQIAGFLSSQEKRVSQLGRDLNLEPMFSRDINRGLSGGEMKRSELFQLVLQNPFLLLLDEPESGVDIENISLMGKILNEYLKKQRPSCLIITHTGYILDYIEADSGCVMVDGELHCANSSPAEVFRTIKDMGYERCKECHGQH